MAANENTEILSRFLEAKRKTFFRGEIHGKFRGELDEALSNATPSNIYNATIYNANINHIVVRKEQEGHFPFNENEVFINFAIENPVDCYFENKLGKGHHYELTILEQKLESIALGGINVDGNNCHGLIDAIIYGYIEDTVKHPATGNIESKEEGYRLFERLEYRSHLGFDYWGDWEFKGYIAGLTGNEQTFTFFNRRIIRKETINKNGETNWGKPIVEKEESKGLWFWLTRILIGALLLFLLFFLIAHKMWGGAFVLLLIGLSLYYFLFGGSRIGWLFQWGARLLSLFFFVGLLFGLINIFKTGIKRSPKKITRNDYTYSGEVPEEADKSIANDSIISHWRIWKDYNNNMHSGYLSLFVSDYRASFNNHFNTEKNLLKSNGLDFKTLYYNLSQHDNPGMKLIIEEFESLAYKNNYETRSKKFAELIVSCIQDIPYALIIPSCNLGNVSDKEVRQLLKKDCPCKESFPDGVQAPLEFMGDLKGDCDTRALFLYAVLKHFGYDVVLMVSERYKHAIIGVNFPRVIGNPVYKLFQGQKYYVWETTAPEMPPGALDPTVNNMNLWNVLLK